MDSVTCPTCYFICDSVINLVSKVYLHCYCDFIVIHQCAMIVMLIKLMKLLLETRLSLLKTSFLMPQYLYKNAVKLNTDETCQNKGTLRHYLEFLV